jgi:hypothetical protein
MLALVEFASSVISLASAGSIVLFLAIQKKILDAQGGCKCLYGIS